MKTFDDLKFVDVVVLYNPGIRSRMMFENGYGVSVVSTKMSYGGKQGLYEVAILNSDGEITYDTPITDDVVGWLTKDGVTDIMAQVQNL